MSNHCKILISAWLQFHTNPHLLALNENPNESTKITRLDSGFYFCWRLCWAKKISYCKATALAWLIHLLRRYFHVFYIGKVSFHVASTVVESYQLECFCKNLKWTSNFHAKMSRLPGYQVSRVYNQPMRCVSDHRLNYVCLSNASMTPMIMGVIVCGGPKKINLKFALHLNFPTFQHKTNSWQWGKI